VVLSNNDGCVIARSDEIKAIEAIRKVYASGQFDKAIKKIQVFSDTIVKKLR